MSGESFLSRWSKKKAESRTEEVKKSERLPEQETQPIASADEARSAAPFPSMQAPAPVAAVSADSPAEALPPVESLTPESDFRPFLGPDVDPRLKNQALKALFKDPHYNIMDGLDTYIDDYSKPDPIPEAMLRRLNQSKMLKLFDDEETQAEGGETAPPQTEAAASSVAAEGPVIDSSSSAEVVQNDAAGTKSPTSKNSDETGPHQRRS